MRVLMISLDKGLVGGKAWGDVIERHIKYGQFVDRLDIIVLCQKGFQARELSQKVHSRPTNSVVPLFYFFDALRIAKALFVDSKYHLIVTQDPFLTGFLGARLKSRYDAKLLVHFHGDFGLNLLTGYVAKRADAIRVMSQGQKSRLIAEGISADKIRVISTPVDIERFAQFEASFPADKKIILMVGRPDSVKGYDVLEKARKIIVQRRTDAAFWVIGSKKINWADKVFASIAPSDLPKYYSEAYAVVLPSYSESFGKVLVEANASMRPVVATATTGAQEIIQDGYNGYLVPIGDAKALAEKIIYLIEHPDVARQMGENGQRLVREKFSGNTEKIIELWKDIVNQ